MSMEAIFTLETWVMMPQMPLHYHSSYLVNNLIKTKKNVITFEYSSCTVHLCTVVQKKKKKNESPLFISMQIILEK